MERIIIIGCAGSGKTTLARHLSERFDAPHICLDSIWLPGWGPADVPKFREVLIDLHGQ